MVISIITPMYNSERYIGQMIQAVRAMDYPQEKIEILIIDNGSDDGSVKVVESYGIQCTVMKGATISQMRNAGALKANGELLGFVDSDCLVSKDWANNAIKLSSEESNTGIIGGHYGLGENPGWVERTWCALKKDFVGDVSFVSAGNMVIKKVLFSKVNGFDESVETGEDWDLCQRVIAAGYKVVNRPSLQVSHLGNVKSLSAFVKKERWYGKGMLAVLKGRYTSKPLVASFVFISCLVFAVAALLTQAFYIFIFSIFLLLALLLAMSYSLTRYIKKNRALMIIKVMPISFCYVLGRSLSILDILTDKLKGKQ